MESYTIIIKKNTERMGVESDYQKLHDKEGFDTKEDPQYGYVEHEAVIKREEKVYEQTVYKEIDLKGVIDAFNSTA